MRTRTLVIRLSDEERSMLDVIAHAYFMGSASEAFRTMLRNTYDDLNERDVARARGRLMRRALMPKRKR